MTDFTKYKNIGPTCAGYLTAAGFTAQTFKSTETEDIFLQCIDAIGPEKALKGVYPRMFCAAVWGAKNDVKWGTIPDEIKDRFKQFEKALHDSL